MGRKSKKGGGGAAKTTTPLPTNESIEEDNTPALSKAAKREVTELVTQLLESKSAQNIEL